MVSPIMASKAYALMQGRSGAGLSPGQEVNPLGQGGLSTGAMGAMGANPAAAGGASAVAPSFGEVLRSMAGETVTATKGAEKQMALNLAGQNQLADVVTAVASAQSQLETVIAIRDQVISAYQEIMRMPI